VSRSPSRGAVVLVTIGGYTLSKELARHEHHGLGPDKATPLPHLRYQIACYTYLASLLLLYCISTMYHASAAIEGRDIRRLAAYDRSAIYLLIAGSYTPFLTILVPDVPSISQGMLFVVWATAVCGVVLSLCWNPAEKSRRWKMALQLSSYLAMGWGALSVLSEMCARLAPHPTATLLLVGGGVAYTGGIPWFVRSGHTCGVPNHTVWHFWVLAGSTMHFLCVLFYLVRFPFEDAPPPWDTSTTVMT
jgi:hemolysin III